MRPVRSIRNPAKMKNGIAINVYLFTKLKNDRKMAFSESDRVVDDEADRRPRSERKADRCANHQEGDEGGA